MLSLALSEALVRDPDSRLLKASPLEDVETGDLAVDRRVAAVWTVEGVEDRGLDEDGDGVASIEKASYCGRRLALF